MECRANVDAMEMPCGRHSGSHPFTHMALIPGEATSLSL
jgi:hypothetical protein